MHVDGQEIKLNVHEVEVIYKPNQSGMKGDQTVDSTKANQLRSGMSKRCY